MDRLKRTLGSGVVVAVAAFATGCGGSSATTVNTGQDAGDAASGHDARPDTASTPHDAGHDTATKDTGARDSKGPADTGMDVAVAETGADSCSISGVTYAAGAANPANACETCVPTASTSGWSNVADGASCGDAATCLAGECTSAQCTVDGTMYPAGPSATNPCQACVPASSMSAFTNVTDGTSCGGSNVCVSGKCGVACTIGGSYFSLDETNPANGCQICDPTTSTTAWTNAGDGFTCSIGTTVATCCSGTCANMGTDSNNCGGCGLACATGCVLGECVTTLASGQSFPSNLAVDATSVYWTNFGGGSVVKVGLAGGMLTTIAQGQFKPSGIGVNGANVYWTNFSNGTIMTAATSGGGTASTLANTQGEPYALTVDATNVYWTNIGAGAASVVQIAQTGAGSPITLVSGLSSPGALTTDGTFAYWTDSVAGAVGKIALGGGGVPLTLATGQAGVEGIGIANSDLFWAVGTKIEEGTTAAGTPLAFAGGQSGAQALTTDDDGNVFWADYTGGSIVTQEVFGGVATTLAAGQGAPNGIVVDATSVYWANYMTGTIMKVTPK
jgi:hypothetical protein